MYAQSPRPHCRPRAPPPIATVAALTSARRRDIADDMSELDHMSQETYPSDRHASARIRSGRRHLPQVSRLFHIRTVIRVVAISRPLA